MTVNIELSKIKITGDNPREDFSSVDDLAENMKEVGLLQPIVIDQHNNLIAGECRYRAAKKLGWITIDALVRSCTNVKERKALAIFENIKRKSLLPAEKMKALAWLRSDWYESDEIKRVGGQRNADEYAPGAPLIAEKVKQETGMSLRAFQEQARIGRLMSVEVERALNEKKITQKQAAKLVKLNKAGQNKALKKLKTKSQDETKAVVSEERGEDKVVVRAKTLYNALAKHLKGLTNILMTITAEEIIFMSIDSRMSLLMVEGKFAKEWKKYKEMQHGSKRNEGQRKRAGVMGQHASGGTTQTALADERTIDVAQ